MNTKSRRTKENQRPLRGKTIVITRARRQAKEFACRLTDLGARVIEFPTIQIMPPPAWEPLDRAIDQIEGYDWLVFTSVNGVRFFMRRFRLKGRDVNHLKNTRICAIGPRTAEEIKASNLKVHLMPTQFRAEGVVEALAQQGLVGKRILLARAKIARNILQKELEKRGAKIDVVAAYETARPKADVSRFLRFLEEKKIDVIAFTSSSTVSNFMEMFATRGDELIRGLEGVAIAVIGPITQDRACQLGLPVHITPREYTIPALVSAIAAYFASEKES